MKGGRGTLGYGLYDYFCGVLAARHGGREARRGPMLLRARR